MATPIRLELYLDGAREPFAAGEPPIHVDFDTLGLEDGPHELRIHAIDQSGSKTVRTIAFEVRNGPEIDVAGLSTNRLVQGTVPMMINAYGSRYREWDVGSAESPRAVPAWLWIIILGVLAWSVFYGVANWSPPPAYASSPTYGRLPAPGSTAMGFAGAPTTSAASGASALGAAVYANNCAACHQSDGRGIPGTFPPLAGNSVVTAKDPSEHIRTVLFGKSGKVINGVSYSASMPPWQDRLSNDQIAAVINHERTSWGNSAPTVTPAQVDSLRQQGPPSGSGERPNQEP